MMIQSRVVKAGLRLLAAGTIEPRSPSRGPRSEDDSPRAPTAPHPPCPACTGRARRRVDAGRRHGRVEHASRPPSAWPATSPTAWERGDMRGMHELLSESSSARFPIARFRRAYSRAAATATLTAIEAGEPEGVRRRRGERAGGGRHARVRQPARRAARAGVGRAGGLGAAAGVPRAARRRAAHPHQRAARARDAALARPQGPRRGPRRRALLTAGGHRRLDRRAHGAGGDPRGAQGALRARVPARLARRAERPRGGVRGAPARPARWRAPGRHPGAGTRAAARRQADPDDHPHRPAGGRRGGARGPARRRGRARPAQRRDPRARRHRLLGTTATRAPPSSS